MKKTTTGCAQYELLSAFKGVFALASRDSPFFRGEVAAFAVLSLLQRYGKKK
jgi:hypothetical protein